MLSMGRSGPEWLPRPGRFSGSGTAWSARFCTSGCPAGCGPRCIRARPAPWPRLGQARPGRVAAQLAAVQHAPGTEVETWVVDWLAAAAPALTYLAPAVAADLIRDVLAELADADPRREDLEASLVTVAFLLLDHDEVDRVGRRLLTQARDPDRAAEMTWMVSYTLLRTGRAAEASATVKAGLGRAGLGEVWTARLTALDALLQLILGLPDGERVLHDALAVAERSGTRWPSATRCTPWQCTAPSGGTYPAC